MLDKLQEYDVDVRPLKLVKGQGLCKLIVGIDVVNLSMQVTSIAQVYQNDWYKYLATYLKIEKLPIMISSKEKGALKIKENSYVLVSMILFKINCDGVLLICLLVEKIHEILKEMHEIFCEGHFIPKVTAHQIITVRYYWIFIFKNSYSIRKCSACQKKSRLMKRVAILMQPIMVDASFMQWRLDVIGSINPNLGKWNSYILSATKYLKKWKEARALKMEDTDELISFVEENILSFFGVPE